MECGAIGCVSAPACLCSARTQCLKRTRAHAPLPTSGKGPSTLVLTAVPTAHQMQKKPAITHSGSSMAARLRKMTQNMMASARTKAITPTAMAQLHLLRVTLSGASQGDPLFSAPAAAANSISDASATNPHCTHTHIHAGQDEERKCGKGLEVDQSKFARQRHCRRDLLTC